VDAPGADILRTDRACDAERSRYISHLSRCLQAGYIPGEVFTARMEAAAECVTRDQLAALLADLPALTEPTGTLRDRAREVCRGDAARRWLHIAAAAAAACWAVMIPVLIFSGTGHTVVYGHGTGQWAETQHSGPALAVMFFFVITGVVGLIADIIWWVCWEDV
jgi:hypothetical protein